MSIIHDALKKLQQGLAPKTEVTPPTPETALNNLYETPVTVETLPKAGEETIDLKPPKKSKIKNILTICAALAVIAGSGYYLYYQYQGSISQVKRFAKKSFYKLILHKEEVPAFKTMAPQDLKPLARLTVNSAQSSSPVTLNIHGIMANGTGNLVLINDEVYQEGDEVNGAKIVKINLDSITVNIDGAEKTIFVRN
jgi:hypothetical protein